MQATDFTKGMIRTLVFAADRSGYVRSVEPVEVVAVYAKTNKVKVRYIGTNCCGTVCLDVFLALGHTITD